MRNTLFQTVATSLAVMTLGVSLATTPVLAGARHAAEAVAAHATSRPSIAAAAPMSNMPGMGMAAVEDITGVQPRGR
jgi:hypothetical protein